VTCRIAWCQSAHGNGGAHYGEGPTVGGVSMLYLLSDVDGQPIIRVSYPTAERAQLDFTPQLAADLANMLSAVRPDQVVDLRNALAQAAHTLGDAA
jgi:hypothetical protein